MNETMPLPVDELELDIPKVKDECKRGFIMRVEYERKNLVAMGCAKLSTDLSKLTIFTRCLDNLEPGTKPVKVSIRFQGGKKPVAEFVALLTITSYAETEKEDNTVVK